MLQYHNIIIYSLICRGEWREGLPSPVVCFPTQMHVSFFFGLQPGPCLCYYFWFTLAENVWVRNKHKRASFICSAHPVHLSGHFSSSLWPSHCFPLLEFIIVFIHILRTTTFSIASFISKDAFKGGDIACIPFLSTQSHPLPEIVLWSLSMQTNP